MQGTGSGVVRKRQGDLASAMIEKFAIISGEVPSEFIDLNHTSKSMLSSVPYDSEVRSRPQQRSPANFGIGTLGSPLLERSGRCGKARPRHQP